MKARRFWEKNYTLRCKENNVVSKNKKKIHSVILLDDYAVR